jgi:2-polyprenyl-6-methoxyphenol hydroxylase-like FAD-dependent oxidoreductase
MRNRKVLVSGAGIAGPTLAYWLSRQGFEPTLVERAPALRTGGYMIDFSGPGYDVTDRMGLLPAISRDRYDIEEVRLVDGRGRTIADVDGRLFQSAMSSRYVSVLRADFARHVYSTIEGEVDTIFADGVRSIHQARGGVEVEFAGEGSRGAPARAHGWQGGQRWINSP